MLVPSGSRGRYVTRSGGARLQRLRKGDGRRGNQNRQGHDEKVPEKLSIKYREEEFQFTNLRVDYKNKVIRAVFTKAFFKELVDFYMEEYKEGVRPRVTVALINGELGIVGGSGEFFCNHSIRLKERARLPHTLFFGYCNDYQWYFPTIEAAAEGGYGADGTVSPSPVGAGETIVNRGLFTSTTFSRSSRESRFADREYSLISQKTAVPIG